MVKRKKIGSGFVGSNNYALRRVFITFLLSGAAVAITYVLIRLRNVLL
ncbi:hypothetical protein [Clostridium sp. Marseille-Q2269]|nr:hypothetical protein [Clostridium sp. Marseille-Q2269]